MKAMLRYLKYAALGLLGLIAILLLVGAAYQAIATRNDMARLGSAGELHAVNGKSLYIDCRGDGRPTLVFEPGAGSWSTHWRHIQDSLAATTRVCLYDRAGLGRSEPAPEPMSGAEYVRDLHELLRSAGEQPPFILVGHSLGGYLARLYYAAYPSEVAGVVLAESAHEDQWRRFPPQLADLLADRLGQMRMAGWMSRFGILRMTGMPPLGLPTAEQEASARAFMLTSAFWYGLLAEFEAGMNRLPDEVAGTTGLGDLPLLVITAGKSVHVYCATDGSGGVPCAETQAIWNELQADLARLSSDSRHVVLDDALHTLYVDAPDELIRHIGRFVRSVRSAATGVGPI